MITHVLDSSAVLAHYLHEPGATEVHALLQGERTSGFSVACFPELKIRLRELVPDSSEVERVFALYSRHLVTPLEVSLEAAKRRLVSGKSFDLAFRHLTLRSQAVRRHDAILVHRDPHLRFH